MKKIVKQIIKDSYVSFDIETLQVDSIIDFDCYIKRYNDYVVIIEKGTLITKKLLQHIQGNKEFFIHNLDVKKYQDYSNRVKTSNVIDLETVTADELSDFDKAIEDVKALPKQIQRYDTGEEKLRLAYKNICKLIHICFEDKSIREHLPLDAIQIFIDVALHLIKEKEGLFHEFLKIPPAGYQNNYHSVNVCIFSIFLGHEIGLEYSKLKQLAMAAILHDIGKGRIESSILDKNDALDHDEYEIIQTHSSLSAELAAANKITDRYILDAILYHHEKFDGSGYPKGLREKLIPKMAQIVAVADAFDALTTERTFRPKYSSFAALSLMRAEMAKHLNQDYITILIKLLQKQSGA